MNKKYSICIFFVFSLIIFGAIFYYAPGWGFMDDVSCLNISDRFFRGEITLLTEIQADQMDHGRFRPIYQLWQIFGYTQKDPLKLYLGITFINLFVLLIWGKILVLLFPDEENNYFLKYVYPLIFFLFTPFWNIFMYISVQEKFVYIFGTLAIYCFLKSNQFNKKTYLFASVVFSILAVLGKETAISIMGSFMVYSFLDIVLFRKNTKFSSILLIIYGFFTVGYFFLIQKMLKAMQISNGYTAKYQNHLGILGLWVKVGQIPIVIRCVFFIAIISIILFFVNKYILKRKTLRDEYLVIPLFLVLYILVLLPWGIFNYLMGPLAPLIFVTVCPLFLLLIKTHKNIRFLLQGSIVIISFLILFSIVIPRISKTADIRKIVEFVVNHGDIEKEGHYLFPGPFSESAGTLKKQTDADIYYIGNKISKFFGGVNEDLLNKNRNNYFIFHHQTGSVYFKDTSLGEEVYSNGTWKIFRLKYSPGADRIFKPQFKENIMQKMKDKIKTYM